MRVNVLIYVYRLHLRMDMQKNTLRCRTIAIGDQNLWVVFSYSEKSLLV